MAAIACAGLAATSLAGAGAASAGRGPERVLATGTEFDLILSRTRVDPGEAIVEFANAGEDVHDLKAKKVGSRHVRGTGAVLPGDEASLAMTLKPSARYRLWCSIADHRELGMEAELRTRAG